MTQETSVFFSYRGQYYELVKANSLAPTWTLYTVSVNGRQKEVLAFSDMKFSKDQAEHVAMHCLRQRRIGFEEGSSETKRSVAGKIREALGEDLRYQSEG